MPALLDKSVAAIRKKGVPQAMAYGMAVASLQKAGLLKMGTVELTEEGKKMNRFLTPNEVAGRKKGPAKKKTSTRKTQRSKASLSPAKGMKSPKVGSTTKKKTSVRKKKS